MEKIEVFVVVTNISDLATSLKVHEIDLGNLK